MEIKKEPSKIAIEGFKEKNAAGRKRRGAGWEKVYRVSEKIKKAFMPEKDDTQKSTFPSIMKAVAAIAAVAAVMLAIKMIDSPVTNTMEQGLISALDTALAPDDDLGKLKFVWNEQGQTATYIQRKALDMPVEGAQITASNINGDTGLLIMAEDGAVVRASAPGEVTATGINKDWGRFVRITHPSGIETVYYGLDEITAGGYVERLQEIGRLSGEELYFQVYENGDLKDPLPYFEESGAE